MGQLAMLSTDLPSTMSQRHRPSSVGSTREDCGTAGYSLSWVEPTNQRPYQDSFEGVWEGSQGVPKTPKVSRDAFETISGHLQDYRALRSNTNENASTRWGTYRDLLEEVVERLVRVCDEQRAFLGEVVVEVVLRRHTRTQDKET